jgi:hypothetical protein
MAKRVFIFFLFIISISNLSNAQTKVVILDNLWHNELNNFSPKQFFENLYGVLKQKLLVNDIVTDSKVYTGGLKAENWESSLKEQIKEKKSSAENLYYVAMASDLRLPAVNLGKFLFKKPPRTSKFTFTLHVYDTAGVEVIGDTIINRGCLVKTIDEEKGPKYFYSDYNSFISDMDCHLKYIGKILQEKPVTIKKSSFINTK